MDRNSIDWYGPLVALITPFKKSGEIDKDSLIINAMSPIHLINEMNKKNTRTIRNRVRITKEIGDKEEIVLITVRVHDCIRGKV